MLGADAVGFTPPPPPKVQKEKRSCSDDTPAVRGTRPEQTIHSSLRGNCMPGWRVILLLHTAMSRKSERRKEGEGDLALHESEPEWWHCPRVPAECTYTSTSGGRAIHASEPPQVDKGTSGQMDENPLRCSVRSAVGALISIMSLRFPDRFRGN